jgi:hypothetical protein
MHEHEKRKVSIETNLEITEISEFADRKFKIAIINMFKYLNENVNAISREMKNINSTMLLLKLKIIIKKSLNGFNNQIKTNFSKPDIETFQTEEEKNNKKTKNKTKKKLRKREEKNAKKINQTSKKSQ